MRRALVLLAGLALAFTSMACQGNVFQLKVGDCFNGAATGTVSDVSTVDCATAHDAEVYFIFDYPNAPSPLSRRHGHLQCGARTAASRRSPPSSASTSTTRVYGLVT